MTEEEAQGLSDTLARVMDTFINKPHQLVEELDLSKVDEVKEPEFPATETITKQPELYTSETQLRTVINECVREIIDRLFKSGALISQDQQKINNTIQIATQQPIQPMIDYSQMSEVPRRPQFERTKSAGTVASRRLAQLSRVEQKLLSVWSELLQISEDSIKKDDSFFQLGGDSIIAMQMVGMAKDQIGHDYYLVKNSWGTDKNDLNGYFYCSVPFFEYKTTTIMVNKHALPKDVAKKLGIKI